MSKPKTPPLDGQIAQLQAEISTLDANWKRALADYQNLVRRMENDKKEFVRLSNANLIARLLPSLDIMEMAAVHTKDIGVEMAAKQFSDALIQEGLQLITPQPGEVFDPHLHEAADTVAASPEHLDNTIAEIVLKGYKIGDYILRPAKVKVFKNSDSIDI